MGLKPEAWGPEPGVLIPNKHSNSNNTVVPSVIMIVSVNCYRNNYSHR